MGGEKHWPSQAEKALDVKAEKQKNAARAEERKAAVAAAEDAHRLAPTWLRQAAASFGTVRRDSSDVASMNSERLPACDENGCVVMPCQPHRARN